MVNWFFDKGHQDYSMEKRILILTNDVRSTDWPIKMHKNESGPLPHSMFKHQLRMDKAPALQGESYSNTYISLCDLELGNSFLKMTSRTQVSKDKIRQIELHQ